MGRNYTYPMNDERERLIEKAKHVLESDPADNVQTAAVLDAALTHLVQSEQAMKDARDHLPPNEIQRFNTDVLRLHYRTTVDAEYRNR